MGKKRSLSAIFAFLAILAIATLLLMRRKTASADDPNGKMPTVATVTAKESRIGKLVALSGFAQGESRSSLAPAVSGRILSLQKREGDFVRKGEVIAVIDAKGSDAQIRSAQANIEALERTLRDTEKYYGQLVDQADAAKNDANDLGNPTDAAKEAIDSAKKGRDLQIQSVRDQLVAAQGALDVARTGKSDFSVLAPFSGTLLSVNAKAGDFASFGVPIASLAATDKLELETYVSATDGRSLSVGNTVLLENQLGMPFSGTITAVAPGSAADSLKTLIRIWIDDATGNLRIGDFLKGSIAIPSDGPLVAIPRRAVVFRGGDPIVFVLTGNDTVEERPVRLGSEQSGSVTILDGISLGERIVSEGQQHLVNGLTVSPYERND